MKADNCQARGRYAGLPRRGLRNILAVLLSVALAGLAQACTGLPGGSVSPPAVTQPAAVGGTAPTPIQPVTGSATGAATPGGNIYFPAVPKEPCAQSSATLELATSTLSLSAGQSLTVTATLQNTGCLGLGLPQYRLTIEAPQAVLTPTQPSAITHYLAVAPGQSDSAAFALQGVAAGQALIRGQASFEVHQGYPGPAYWGAAASPPVTVMVR